MAQDALWPAGAIPILDLHAWLGAGGVLGLAFLLGLAALPRLRGWRWSDGALARLAAGLPLVALAVLLVGQGRGVLFAFPWKSLIALGAALGWVLLALTGLYHFLSRCRLPEELTPAPLVASERLLRALGWLAVILALLLPLGLAFCPPLNYDVLEYHQGLIPHVFELGRVRPIPHVFYTAQPLATEMLYTLAAALEAAPWGFAPGALHFFLIVLGVLFVARGLDRLAIPTPWRPWLVLLLLSHPIVLTLQLDRMTDWTGLMLLGAGAWAWLAGRERETAPHAVRPARLKTAALLGLLAGGAVSAKWTHAGTVALSLFLLAGARGLAPAEWPELFPQGRRDRLRLALACLGLFAGVAFLTWLPWGIWLWVVRGNPCAPFLAGLFPTPDWPPARLEFLRQTHGPLSPFSAAYWANLAARLTWELRGLPLIPLAFVALLAVVALGLARRHSGKSPAPPFPALAGWLALGSIGGLLLWGQLRHAADRFLAPLLLVAVLILAQALAWLIAYYSIERPQSLTALRRAVGGLLALAALLAAYSSYAPFTQSGYTRLIAATAGGRVAPGDYWREMLGGTADLFAAANALPEGTRLLAVNEARRYPFRHPVSLASVFDQSPLRPAVSGARNGEQIRRRLAAQGYTHFLFNGYEQARILRMHTPPALIDNPAFKALLDSGDETALLERSQGATEFSLDPPAPAELAAYGQFLALMRARALWQSNPGQPAMWLAPF